MEMGLSVILPKTQVPFIHLFMYLFLKIIIYLVVDPSSFEVNSNIVIPNADQENNGSAGQAVSLTDSDWNLIHNWFQTDLSCTMPDCREQGIYTGYCLDCNHMLLCIPHARMCSMNQYHCLRCQQPLIWSQLAAIISDRNQTAEPTQETP